MKLKFKDQKFQDIAVNAVVDLFKGQEKSSSNFTMIVNQRNGQQLSLDNNLGVCNDMLISLETVENNMHAIQERHSLEKTVLNKESFPQFCVEMETGTGKTFVYTKSIYELNQKYGFTKFIIVVPSVAIREGVYKSLQSTHEFFKTRYNNTPIRYFIYNSKNPNIVRGFATSNNIEIMIINIDAFKKDENIINRSHEKLQGETAMSFIQNTNPVVIIDEPQSVDNTAKSKEAIKSLNPLCVLRYSATHKDEINVLYKLTPIDAFKMGLVKQIVLSSNEIEKNNNQTYIKLLSVSNKSGFSAKVEIDVQDKEFRTVRKIITIKQGDDLYDLSNNREVYEGFVLSGIDCGSGRESVEFDNTTVLKLGETLGNIDENIIKKAQIKRTIEAHLEKEKSYIEKGIKVLSLFFIDKVEKYRHTDGSQGEYAKMFEECYNELIEKPKYATIKTKFSSDVNKIHNGYFSQDKKGVLKDTKGDTQADDDTYNTIMKDKEWLLDFKCPLRFIFSHSALKEGWDNPNVFQVCTLIEQKSHFTQRQKIGRGLRLCVNQDGERIEDKDINILHVMANESFANFVSTLEEEYRKDTGISFGLVQISMFNGLKIQVAEEKQTIATEDDAKDIVEFMKQEGYLTEDNRPTEKAIEITVQKEVVVPKQIEAAIESIKVAVEEKADIKLENIVGKQYTQTVVVERTLNYNEAVEIVEDFKSKGYIDSKGKIKNTMKEAINNGTLEVLEKYAFAKQRFVDVCSNASVVPPIRDAKKEVTVRLKKEVLINEEFKALWDKIKQKTTYRVNFNVDELKNNCIAEITKMPKISRAILTSKDAELRVEGKGVGYTETSLKTINLDITSTFIPNIINIIAKETTMKKQDVFDIIKKSERLADFYNNPQEFLEKTLDIIKRCRQKLAIDGIKYIKLDGEEYYAQKVFDTAEILAYLDKNAVEVKNSVYSHIIYDSTTVEKPFALALDNDENVKMYFKIPSKFKIKTPIGNYNPDWAVVYNNNGEEKIYLVIETKGNEHNLKTNEYLKNKCGEEHFKAINNGTGYIVNSTGWNEAKTRL